MGDPMLDESVWAGVEFYVDHYVEAKTDDCIVILYTPDSRESAAWVNVALRNRGIAVEIVSMLPIVDSGIQERLAAALIPRCELTGRLVILSFERDTMSHDQALRNALAPYDPERLVVFRTISAGPDFFRTAIQSSPSELNAKNAALLEFFIPAKTLYIKTDSGSELNVQLDNEKHQWISNRGMWRPGRYVILPAGEIATYPADISGVFVADFAFNLNAITRRDTRLGRHPVTMHLQGGQLSSFSCESREVTEFLDECFTSGCNRNVGELGFGTNHHVKEAVSENSHINERCPGVHLGFGQHNQHPTVVEYQCDLHLDLITKGGLVWTDCASEPINLSRVVPSKNVHPSDFRDEDVFSPSDRLTSDDCCGMFRSEALELIRV